jgi:hypothetical protein
MALKTGPREFRFSFGSLCDPAASVDLDQHAKSKHADTLRFHISFRAVLRSLLSRIGRRENMGEAT